MFQFRKQSWVLKAILVRRFRLRVARENRIRLNSRTSSQSTSNFKRPPMPSKIRSWDIMMWYLTIIIWELCRICTSFATRINQKSLILLQAKKLVKQLLILLPLRNFQINKWNLMLHLITDNYPKQYPKPMIKKIY